MFLMERRERNWGEFRADVPQRHQASGQTKTWGQENPEGLQQCRTSVALRVEE
jgi:hypothetical protein